MSYSHRIQALLTPPERAIFKKLTTPQKIQSYLDTLPMNFEMHGETYMSPRKAFKARTAHCFEGALIAAAAMAYHGKPPLLLDLKTTHDDEDHVLTLFRKNGYWGAVSKTNHAVLRYRDPVYKTVRELAMSCFHEYVMNDGRKSLRAFSKPFELRKYSPEKWVTAEEDLNWLVEKLDNARHSPIVPRKNAHAIRRASKVELDAWDEVEWKVPKGSKS